MKVYCLHHKHMFDESDYDDKIIGYFTDKDIMHKTIERYKTITGFRDYPEDFWIEELEFRKCKRIHEIYYANYEGVDDIEIMIGRYASKWRMHRDYNALMRMDYFKKHSDDLCRITSTINVDFGWEEGFTTYTYKSNR